jgi:hypothetical protein
LRGGSAGGGSRVDDQTLFTLYWGSLGVWGAAVAIGTFRYVRCYLKYRRIHIDDPSGTHRRMLNMLQYHSLIFVFFGVAVLGSTVFVGDPDSAVIYRTMIGRVTAIAVCILMYRLLGLQESSFDAERRAMEEEARRFVAEERLRQVRQSIRHNQTKGDDA